MLTEATLQSLARKLTGGNRQEQLRAIQVLSAESSDPRVVTVLLSAVSLDDPTMQVRALSAIPSQHMAQAEPVLQTMLTHHNADLRRVAVQLLGKMRSEASLYLLAKRLEDDSHWVRWDAIDAIAWQNEPWVAEAIVKMLYDSDARVRRRACEVFAMGLTPLPVSDLLVALTDPDQWVRFWAIEALRAAGDDHRAVQAVANSLFDAQTLVRDRAIRSLGYMLASGAVPLLRKLAETEDANENLLSTLLHTLRRFETDEAQALRHYCKQRIKQLRG